MRNKKTTIYFICPTNKTASGGVKQIYRQVQTLTDAGYDAVLLLRKVGKSENWFRSKRFQIKSSPYLFKRIKYSYKNKRMTIWRALVLKTLKLISHKIEKNAILVFPEIYGPQIHTIQPDNKCVIFNQNCYYTFDHFPLNSDSVANPYTSKNTLATIVASEDAKNYFDYTFPASRTFRIMLGINSDLFAYQPTKKKQICFMPRKLEGDVKQVINILRIKGLNEDWHLLPIIDKTEEEVAKIMKDSMIFLSFNHREGFGLPPVEAMSCGCYVIGYQGRGGKEYFDPDFSTTIDEGNIIDYVDKLRLIIDQFENFPQQMLAKGKKASDYVQSKYSIRNEEQDTLNAWKKILDMP